MKIGLLTVSRIKFLLVLAILLFLFLPLPRYTTVCNSSMTTDRINCEKKLVWSRPLYLQLIDRLALQLEPGAAYDKSNGNSILERVTCFLKRGNWGRWGLYPREYCQVPAPDAGKSCTDGSQCSLGSCISQNGKNIGVCQKYPGQFGCIQYLNNGIPGNKICID